MLLELLKLLLMVSGLIGTALGLFVVYHIARPQNHPADSSNRINKVRLLWFCLTREEKFVGQFPWLKKDEWDNVNR